MIRMKKLYLISILTLIAFVLIYSCSAEEEDTTPPPSVVATPEPEPPAPIQYNLTVTAGEGGSVSTEGGTYDEGTQVTVSALPDEGYGFLGWEGNNSDSSSLNLTINADTTIQALFAELPALVLPSSPSKMFTRGIADTLLFSFSSSAGYKSIDIQSELGSVEIIQEPEVGVENGDVILQYTPNSIGNVNHMVTIAGHDDINISITDQNDLETNELYRIRTQPEPIFKNYLLPSHDLFSTRNKSDLNLIRYQNQRDNLYQNWCNGVYENFNLNGNIFDELDGVAYADVDGDGYDDIFFHPTYQDNAGGFTSIANEFELYLYKNGSYVFEPINWGNKIPLERHLARKIIVGDFDNDGDPDFYAASLGLDIPPYTGENNCFIINRFNEDRSFDYRIHDLLSGSHEASSADIDGDGDLDIFSVGIRDNAPQNQYNSKFFENKGNFNFPIWEDRMLASYNKSWAHWRSTFHSELVDVDNDGSIDLLVMGHEWDGFYDWCTENADGNCGRGKIYWGDENGVFNEERKTFIPKVPNFGTSTDIDVVDIDLDGINELIITRTGGDVDSFPILAENLNVNIGLSNYYGGHFIQICKIDSDRNIIDYTDELIESNKFDSPNNFCIEPESDWFIQTRIEDYDGDGILDIFNSLVGNLVQHRWEWNGTRFIKISP